MKENEISYDIRGAAFKVYNRLGPGLLDKSVDLLIDIHHKQLLSYLKLTNRKLGLLINFNTTDLKSSIIRIIN
jgi:hypothetical protein